jgi:hypothetical protein
VDLRVTERLSWIKPEDITHVWDMILPGIQNIGMRSREGWRPEDVYAALRTGGSVLHIGYLGEVYVGFVVTTLIPGYRDKSLNIWLCFNASSEDALDIFGDDLIQVAKEAGAARLTFYSPRAGWEKRLKDYGFRPVRTVFEKEL